MRFFKTPRFLFWLFPKRTWGFSLQKNTVYLTFDDGPTDELSQWILDFLARENIPATFFCVGANLLKHPDFLPLCIAKGHQIGSHTMNHENSAKTPWKQYKSSVDECSKLVGNTVFRPPYGRLSAWQSWLIAKQYKIIMWSWLSYDYDKEVSIASILASAEKDIRSGHILVLHDNNKVEERVKVILPELVKIVQKKGLKFDSIPA